MPSNLKTIDDTAFYYCESLQSIDIPATVGTIGSAAFGLCTALKEITIPEGVKTIEDDTFYNCSSLARITLPSTLTTIGSGAFIGCTSLKRVDISDIANWCKINFGYDSRNNPLSVANAALYLNGSEIISIDADMGIDSFSSYCFNGCSSIKYLDANRKEIGSYAFEGCPNLEKVSSLSKIGDYAFRNCTKLQTISYLSKASIGTSAFEGCTELTSISHSTFSYTEYVGTRAFYGCEKLNTISLSEDKFTNTIGESAFEGCTSLTQIVVGAKNNAAMSVGIKAFKGCTALKIVTFNYGGYQITIKDSAFEGCHTLSTLTIPSGISSGLYINNRAFYGCGELTEVDLGAYIKSIGTYAFYRSTGSLKVTCRTSTPPTGASQMFFTPTATMTLEISVPSDSVNTYKERLYWKDYANYIVGY